MDIYYPNYNCDKNFENVPEAVQMAVRHEENVYILQ